LARAFSSTRRLCAPEALILSASSGQRR